MALRGDELVAGRDPLGQKPLYYGEGKDGSVVFASLEQPLIAASVDEPKAFPPGCTVRVTDNASAWTDTGKLAKPTSFEFSEEEAVETLSTLLLEAVERTVPAGSALAFSGGIDSSLVAEAMRRGGLEPHLVCVGVEGQPEIEHASTVAEQMRLEITTRVLSESDILETLQEVVETVETEDPTIVAISIPFYFACQEAHDLGLGLIVAGQLSDELFGGYGRFEQLVLNGSFEDIDPEIWDSVKAAVRNDFEPCDKVAVASGLELRSPFAYLPLVQYALSLSAGLKLKVAGQSVTRKYVLRRLAARWMLPESVVGRPKKAFQYSTGVQRVLVKEAKRKRKTLGQLIARA